MCKYDLLVLRDELREVEQQIGSLAAYRDFLFVLDWVTAQMPQRVPSGYSR